ncbi:MAG: DNA mismatch repair endonuclease MutL [Aureispira sp.]|nr:DNA mismatch repair endonuclease MutL [Aureispira sp.]
MSDIIQLLPDNIANQIAAGEVVQRPASVVKELLENSIDAGAQNIRLILKDAGRTLIQVVDDGIGMSETDARMCFERHATSKIRKASDLFSIRTMGFRGEAMASIAAVAQVEMRTKKRDQELGVHLVIEGSEILTQEPCQTAAGTSLSVKNLFFNVPARRTFLKSNAVEMRHILDEFQRVALANPDIFFSLHHNGNKLFHLPKANLRQRIVGVLGTKVNKSLIPIEEETDVIHISGYIGKPEASKKTRGEQFFFVNNRFIKSSYLHHALVSAYEDLIPQKVYPLYVVFFELDPAKIDVNVHPTKQEIKFEDERLVYNYLKVTARHALAQNSVTPTLDFDVETSISKQFEQTEETSFRSLENTKPKTSFSDFNKTSTSNSSFRKERTALENSNLNNWEQLYEKIDTTSTSEHKNQNENIFDESVKMSSKMSDTTLPFDESATPEHTNKQLYQLHNQYIVSPIKSGFMLIDQHAAHQRVLYERYLQTFTSHRSSTQKLLFPRTVNFSVSDAELLKSILPQLNDLGIDIKELQANSFIIHGLPVELSNQNEQVLIEQLLEQYKQNLELRYDVHDNVARSLAYYTAIRSGKSLTSPEMQQLVDELFACEVPYKAPNGRKTFITLKLEELSKRFE